MESFFTWSVRCSANQEVQIHNTHTHLLLIPLCSYGRSWLLRLPRTPAPPRTCWWTP